MGKAQEIKYVTATLTANGCHAKVISEVKNLKQQILRDEATPTREEIAGMLFAWADPSNVNSN